MDAYLNQFKIVRWWKGGLWAYYEGRWTRADFLGFHRMKAVTQNGSTTIAWFHHAFSGITKRENYTGCNAIWH